MRQNDEPRKFTGDLKMSPNGKHFVHRGIVTSDLVYRGGGGISNLPHDGSEPVIATLPHVTKKEGRR